MRANFWCNVLRIYITCCDLNYVNTLYYFRYRERTRRRLILEADFEESQVVALMVLDNMY